MKWNKQRQVRFYEIVDAENSTEGIVPDRNRLFGVTVLVGLVEYGGGDL